MCCKWEHLETSETSVVVSSHAKLLSAPGEVTGILLALVPRPDKAGFCQNNQRGELGWEEMVGPRLSWALFVVLNLGEALSEAGGYKN